MTGHGSQSCPLIAQPHELIDGYIEALERVWHHRAALVDWTDRETLRPA